MTFEEWWTTYQLNFSLDDVDSLKLDFRKCWDTAFYEGAQYDREFNTTKDGSS